MGEKKKLGKNQLVYPLPAVLVGTYNEDHTPNAMVAAWCSSCCNDPPSIGVAVHRKRLTYANIERSDCFTINVPSCDQVTAVDYIGITSGKTRRDKLCVAGLETSPATLVDAPLVDSCPICIECELIKHLPIGSHTWFVGEVMETHVAERVLREDGRPDPAAIDPLAYCTTVREYRRLGGVVAPAFETGKALK
jgi:flavin reductase (DIM6/NTAB) family NADH-FMN oxidoreductase RutF